MARVAYTVYFWAGIQADVAATRTMMQGEVESVRETIKGAAPFGAAQAILQTREKEMKTKLVRWGLSALMVGTLAACGGGGGGGGDEPAPPPVVVVPPPAAPAVAVPTGLAPVTLTATTPAATFAALAPVVTVGGVTIASPPCVSFSIADANNNGIIGFGSKSQSATASAASYPNLAFSLAKLVPGATTGSGGTGPSKWVSYIVTNVPAKDATTGVVAAAVPSRPATDNTGALTDNKNGTYTYCFYRDVPKIKDTVAGLTDPTGSAKADLGDLTYDPNLTHRLTIALSGNAPGTGTNTPTAVQTTDGVPMRNPVNVFYDFIPATGKAVAATDLQRVVVAKESCNECHYKLGGVPGTKSQSFHGGVRFDPNYCVVCHTDQRKYGRTNVTSTAGKFPALTETKTVNATTGITSYSYLPTTYVTDGETLLDFPRLIHRIHQGHSLVKENYANVRALNNKAFSMLDDGQRMCSKCHNNTKAAQADNWNTVPSRIACGACHDGINFATGGGSTLADKAAASAVGAVLATSGHAGKAQSVDTNCFFCHAPADIKVVHQTDNVTKNNPTVTAGLKNFRYDIKSATVSAGNDLAIVFRILADGAAVTLNTPASPAPSTSLTGFTGGPGFLLAWASDSSATDGVASPVDYNNAGKAAGAADAQATSVSLASFMNSATASLSLSVRDADGYYTATIKSTHASMFPVGATMRAVAMQSYYTQVSPAAARHAPSVVKEVTGDAVRRKVVDAAKCTNCHEWLELHGGSRVLAPETGTVVCTMCHNPRHATSGRGIEDATLAAYTFNAADQKILDYWKFDRTKTNAALAFPVTSNNFKDMVHGIHAGRQRVTPFMDARDRTPAAIVVLDFARRDFPGHLNKCETCHLSGTYGSVPANTLPSTHESNNAATATPATPALAKASRLTVNATDSVTSPFAAACVACHDSAAAKGHIASQKGRILKIRSDVMTNRVLEGENEQCAFCHGPGKFVDVTVAHNK